MPLTTFVEIPLTQGLITTIDVEDYDLVNQYKWYACRYYKTFYAKRNVKLSVGRWTTQYMHTLITGAKGIDHINLNGLDNRKFNLRQVTMSWNIQNSRARRGSSQYKGVSFAQREEKYKAEIMVDRRSKFLGYFNSEIKAAEAYDKAALHYYGGGAFLNFRD